MMENMNRIRFEFAPNGENPYEDAFSLDFYVAEGLHISRLHSFCCTFARAMGFSEASINEYFGEEYLEHSFDEAV